MQFDWAAVERDTELKSVLCFQYTQKFFLHKHNISHENGLRVGGIFFCHLVLN